MDTIAVLMSTYNGGKYLREQIDSILSQKEVEVNLFVRDDGSVDETKNILTEYAEKHENIRFDFGENLGVGNSFMNLLYSAPDMYDYYAFADQDDIWAENKLYEAIKVLKSSDNYLLYASNQECVDKNGCSSGLRYKEDAKINLTPETILQQNMLAGCTMVFTKSFCEILSDKSHRPSFDLLYNRIHDVWVAYVAALYNGIVYDKRSFIKYRQHDNNVVGVKKRKGERLKKIKNKKLRNGRSLLAAESCEKFYELTQKHDLLLYSSKADTPVGKKWLIKNRKTVCGMTGESCIGFIAKVIFGLY